MWFCRDGEDCNRMSVWTVVWEFLADINFTERTVQGWVQGSVEKGLLELA